MAKLRSIKSETEIELMRTAIDITDKAFRRVLGFTRPGVMEYEIEAEIIHEFIRNRATGHAYTPIIASGPSACVLHYNENNRPCNDGDVILLDFGAEYANYAADLTRCVPVNGKFSPRQRDVYNAVLRVMRAAMKMLVPGNTIPRYHEEVGRVMEDELIKLGLLKADEVKRQDPKQPLYKSTSCTAPRTSSDWTCTISVTVTNRWQPAWSSPASPASTSRKKDSASASRTTSPSPPKALST